MGYSTINLVLYYFSVSFYCVILHLVSTEFFANFHYVGNSDNTIASASGTIMFVYLLFVASILFCSLIYKSKEGIGQFQMATTGLGFFNLFCVGYLSYLVFSLLVLGTEEITNKTVIYTDNIDRTWDFTKIFAISNILYLQILALIALFCYIAPMILNPFKSLFDIIFSLKDYLFYFPMYIHTLLIYAFCNIDDLSGGTKVLKTNPELMKKSNKYKIQYVYRWLSLNMLVTYVMIIINTDPVYKNYFILVISLIFTGNLAFKSIFAIMNHLKYYLYEKHYYNYCIQQRVLEYTNRSKDLMKYIDNIRKTLSAQNGMNFSTVSIQYEDNTRQNRNLEKEKSDLKVSMKMEKSNLGIVVEGRIQTRTWETNGEKKYRTEIIADNIQFGFRGTGGASAGGSSAASSGGSASDVGGASKDGGAGETSDAGAPTGDKDKIDYPQEEINPDDIPF